MVWTDPPYGVGIQDRNQFLADRGGGQNVAPVTGDTLNPEQLQTLLIEAFRHSRAAVSDDASIYICVPGGPDQCAILHAAVAAGWQIRHGLVWLKDQMVMSRSDYHYQHEALYYVGTNATTGEATGNKRRCSK